MARLFDDAASHHLILGSAIVNRPCALVALYSCDDGALDNQSVVALTDNSGTAERMIMNWDANAGSPVKTRALEVGSAGLRNAESGLAWVQDVYTHAVAIFVTATDRRIHQDGTTKVQETSDAGTQSNLDETVIGAGRRSGAVQDFSSGSIAEVAFYDISAWPGATDALKADAFEAIIPALGLGYSPLFFPLGLVAYLPLIRGITDIIGGNVFTDNTGGTVTAHPPIIYPAPRHIWKPPSVGADVRRHIIPAYMAGMN